MPNIADVLIELRSAGGFYWNAADGQPGSFTYAFSTVNPFPQPADGTQSAISSTFSPFLAEQKAAAREAFRLWAEVANITVQEVTDQSLADVQLYNAAPNSLLSAAVVDFLVTDPQTGNTRQTPHLTVNRNLPQSGNLFVLPGQLGFRTLLHEIGHVLGFKHPGPYSGGGQLVSPPPYLGQGSFVGIPDDQRRTVLSDIAFAPHKEFGVWAATPLLIDIAAAQLVYGANMTTRSGAGDVYQFSALTMDVKAIWDGGGTADKIDASNQSTRVWIDLRAGALSSIGPLGTKTDNVAIAFGAEIEDATGGSGDDTLIGNHVANRLEGNTGKDTIDGGTVANAGTSSIPKGRGDGVVDTLIGGADYDTYILRQNGGQDVLDDHGANLIIEYDENDNPVRTIEKVFIRSQAGGASGTSLSGTQTFTQNGPLTITDQSTGISFQIADHQDGDFGIRLIDAPTVAANPVRTFLGDKEDWDSDPNQEGVQAQDDGFGNTVRADGQDGRPDLPQPDRADVFFGSTGMEVERFSTAGGDDEVKADGISSATSSIGGRDLIESGAGRDIVAAGSAINGTGNALDNVLNGNSANNTLTGGAGNDLLDGGAGSDSMMGGAGNDIYYVGSTGDVVTENANEGTDTVNSSITYTLGANVEYLALAGTSVINGTGNALANLLIGNSAANTLVGGAGIDGLEGGAGDDALSDSAGSDNGYLNGGGGTDALTGGSGREFYIGGAANDTVTTGAGADIIAYNSGDGYETINASAAQDNTLSLGGGIAYADLAFRVSANDLVLDAGANGSITFKDWYAGSGNTSVLTLQVIAEAMPGYYAASSDPLFNKKVQFFDFQGLVNAFDAARAADPGLTSWALANGLPQSHLGGSDTEALGGCLAYFYGKDGTLDALSFEQKQAVLSTAEFGVAAQPITDGSSGYSGFTSTDSGGTTSAVMWTTSPAPSGHWTADSDAQSGGGMTESSIDNGDAEAGVEDRTSSRDRLTERLRDLITRWFDEEVDATLIPLSALNEDGVRGTSRSSYRQSPHEIAASWRRIQTLPDAHLANTDPASLGAEGQSLLSGGMSGWLGGAHLGMPAAARPSPVSGHDLRQLQGLSEGLSKLGG